MGHEDIVDDVLICLFCGLYPGHNKPRHGIFVEQRLKQLLQYTNKIEVVVMAPVPVRTSKKLFLFNNGNSKLKYDTYNSIKVYRPEYLSIPLLGKYLNPIMIYLACYRMMKSLLSENNFDLIDAHYFYPDGVAAAILGKFFNLPVVITARGTDINVFPKYFIPRKYIQWAANYCSAIITVSGALKKKLVEIKVPENKITTLINGVDLKVFNLNHLRTDNINKPDKYILMVGNLVDEKRQDLAIKCLQKLSSVYLVLVGGGPNKNKLERLSQKLGVEKRVKFTGNISQLELVDYYSNATLLLLLSEREGMPNVVLEALACGLYVISTNVGGVPEIIFDEKVGLILNDNSVESITKAVEVHLNAMHSYEYISSFSKTLGWDNTSKGQLDIFLKMVKS